MSSIWVTSWQIKCLHIHPWFQGQWTHSRFYLSESK